MSCMLAQARSRTRTYVYVCSIFCFPPHFTFFLWYCYPPQQKCFEVLAHPVLVFRVHTFFLEDLDVVATLKLVVPLDGTRDENGSRLTS